MTIRGILFSIICGAMIAIICEALNLSVFWFFFPVMIVFLILAVKEVVHVIRLKKEIDDDVS